MTRARILLALCLPFATAGAAAAQTHHDSSAPIDFDAAHIELQDRADRVLLTGGVRITQGEMTLAAQRVTVSYTGQIANGSPEVSRLDASGGVTVTRPDQSAQAQYAVYDLDRRVITMIGGVTLKQGANIVSGGRLSINLDSGRATIDGSGVGGTAIPGQVESRPGRVTGRFSVPKRDEKPAPAPQ